MRTGGQQWSYLFLLGALMACVKEPGPVPLPLQDLRTYDLVPAQVKELPGAQGVVLLCKRAPSDATLAFAQFMGLDGSKGARIDFDALPRTVENVTFGQSELFITDVIPWTEGYILVGLGRQIELENRLHLLAYHVDMSGNLLASPMRRYISSGSEFQRTDDLNQLYRSTALGIRTSAGDVFAIVRYETADQAYWCPVLLPLSGNTPFVAATSTPMSHRSDGLHFVHALDGASERALVVLDSSGLLLKWYDVSSSEVILDGTGIITFQGHATPTAVVEIDDDVHVVGYSVEQDVLRPFHNHFNAPADLEGNLVTTGVEGQQSVSIYAARSRGSELVVAYNVYEQLVMTPTALREDLFGDLRIAALQLDGSGMLSGEVAVFPDQGLRALGMHATGSGTVVYGSLHPFVNTAYQHAFFLKVDDVD